MREIRASEWKNHTVQLGEDARFEKDHVFEQLGLDHIAAVRVETGGVTIDLNGAVLDGRNLHGYGIYLRDCDGVTIKNGTIRGFFYGIVAENCSSLTLENLIVSENYDNPGAGWLHETEAPDYSGLGGGMLLKGVTRSKVERCTLTKQFNGLDLILCSDISVRDVDCSHNSNFGLHLLSTHRSRIERSRMDHCLRYSANAHDRLGGCDAAGILIEQGSHHNRFIGNSAVHSGDGIFVRGNNLVRSCHNIFEGNDCSYSPHNAIEDGFGIGNQYLGNICSHSDYGFWVFDTYESLLLENKVEGNVRDGIAMRYGRGNHLVRNTVRRNGRAGMRIWWEPHEKLGGEPSSHYFLLGNTVTHNGQGVVVEKSQAITLSANRVERNGESDADNLVVKDSDVRIS
ncbi:right-handed parallel beta-helix repeat-containing protein [Candidatus Woesearchaeota archaeon]|nr:right-handed parallel beta-helix repeat-containing protein [Candidatus Woesearchaeota archaeon]